MKQAVRRKSNQGYQVDGKALQGLRVARKAP
jgi:hypothetical protein